MSKAARQRLRMKRGAYLTAIVILLIISLAELGWILLAPPRSFLTYGAVHTLPGDTTLVGNVPDTFDYHDIWTSTAPVTVYYMTLEQYTQYYGCRTMTAPIKCVTGNFTTIGPTESSDDVFTLGEGCADYIVIHQFNGQSGTFYPDITVTYNPSTILTGVCSRPGSSS